MALYLVYDDSLIDIVFEEPGGVLGQRFKVFGKFQIIIHGRLAQSLDKFTRQGRFSPLGEGLEYRLRERNSAI